MTNEEEKSKELNIEESLKNIKKPKYEISDLVYVLVVDEELKDQMLCGPLKINEITYSKDNVEYSCEFLDGPRDIIENINEENLYTMSDLKYSVSAMVSNEVRWGRLLTP